MAVGRRVTAVVKDPREHRLRAVARGCGGRPGRTCKADRERAQSDAHRRLDVELVGYLGHQLAEAVQIVGADADANSCRCGDLVRFGSAQCCCRYPELSFVSKPNTWA